jgi:ribonuclease T1
MSDTPRKVVQNSSDTARRPLLARVFGVVFRVLVACTFVAIPLVPVQARVARLADVGTIAVDQLPPQGRQVLQAIRAGGPFVSRRDGIPFGNREGILPQEPRGYYAEYTVPTPGARTRGARRIIAGRGTTGDFRTSNEYYYTNDHYQSFRRIVQ